MWGIPVLEDPSGLEEPVSPQIPLGRDFLIGERRDKAQSFKGTGTTYYVARSPTVPLPPHASPKKHQETTLTTSLQVRHGCLRVVLCCVVLAWLCCVGCVGW